MLLVLSNVTLKYKKRKLNREITKNSKFNIVWYYIIKEIKKYIKKCKDKK